MKTTQLFRTLFSSCAILALATTATSAATIETVAVGNTGNSNDPQGGYGAVDYVYNIGKYEVTNAQYREFLNAKAKSDPHGLYNNDMGSIYGGIARSGSSGNYSYTAKRGDSEWDNRPVNYVSFWDAARFANWMHNGMGSGDTESGSYINIGNLDTFTRTAHATWVIPTENEWYKAAYHKNNGDTGDYWNYATSSDDTPSNDIVDTDPGNNANFYQGGYTAGDPYYTTEVGEFELSASPYGTFDQNGNLWEWNETAIGSSRGLRGGSFFSYGGTLHASTRNYYGSPDNEYFNGGFRVASIPEPGSATLMLCGVGTLLLRRRKK